MRFISPAATQPLEMQPDRCSLSSAGRPHCYLILSASRRQVQSCMYWEGGVATQHYMMPDSISKVRT